MKYRGIYDYCIILGIFLSKIKFLSWQNSRVAK